MMWRIISYLAAIYVIPFQQLLLFFYIRFPLNSPMLVILFITTHLQFSNNFHQDVGPTIVYKCRRCRPYFNCTICGLVAKSVSLLNRFSNKIKTFKLKCQLIWSNPLSRFYVRFPLTHNGFLLSTSFLNM